MIGQVTSGVRCENRSRAVYFTNSENEQKAETEEAGSEGAGPSGHVIKHTNTDLHIMQTGWEEGFCGPSDIRLPTADSGEMVYSDFGWTTEYIFPTREQVKKHEEELKKRGKRIFRTIKVIIRLSGPQL